MGRNPNIMIVDDDEFFLKRIGAAVGDGDRFACSVKAFSVRNKALKALKCDPPDGLIISETFFGDDIKSIYHGQVSVLSEEKTSGTVSRYSGVSVILGTLGEVGNLVLKSPGKGREKVIGVFSFCETGIKTAYALTKSGKLGKNHKVLYINLDEFPSFSGKDALSFSDALYEFRKNSTFKGVDITEKTGKSAGFEYLGTAVCPDDIRSRTPEDLRQFTEALINECGYNRVILDLGRFITRNWDMNLYCDEMEAVCCPSVERQMNGLENFLWHSGRTDLLERIHRVNVADDLEGYTGELEWEINSVKWMNWMN